MEHRWGHRYMFETPVRIVVGDGYPVPGRLRDVSISGALVETDAPLKLLGSVRLLTPVAGFSLQFRATVVRKATCGHGLEWEDGETPDLDLLLEWAVLQHSWHGRRNAPDASPLARRTG